MKATQEIVKSNIKNIYAEKNEGIFLLLKNFTNYFTLSYDPLIYILLLKSYCFRLDLPILVSTSKKEIKFIREKIFQFQFQMYRSKSSWRRVENFRSRSSR